MQVFIFIEKGCFFSLILFIVTITRDFTSHEFYFHTILLFLTRMPKSSVIKLATLVWFVHLMCWVELLWLLLIMTMMLIVSCQVMCFYPEIILLLSLNSYKKQRYLYLILAFPPNTGWYFTSLNVFFPHSGEKPNWVIYYTTIK